MAMMKLRFLGGRYQGRIVDLKNGEFTIGRGQNNDLVLDEDGVSRHHCRIFAEGENWLAEDLESTNGVRVNGTRIEQRQVLIKGDRIGVSSELLLFTDAAGIVEPTPELEGGQAEPGEAGAPWFRILLLVAVTLLIAWLLYGILADKPATTAATPDTELVDAAVAPVHEREGVTMSDAELAELMAEAEGETTDAIGVDLADAVAAGNDQAMETPLPEDRPPQRQPAAAVSAAPGAGTQPFAVYSQPSGAEVFINEQKRGETPLILSDIKPGRHRIALRKSGYEELSRQIHMPDALPREAYVLHQKAGTVIITSEPAGASIWHGSQILGRTPLLLHDFPTGEHELRLRTAGYETETITMQASSLRGENRHLVLKSLQGNLEVTTIPADCRIIIDNSLKGITQIGDEKKRQSKPFRVEGLLEGQHVLRVEHPNGSSKTGKITIQRGQTTRIPVKLWIIDTKIVLNNGTVKYGMLVEKNDFGDVVLAESPQEMERYLAPQLEEVKELTAAEARQVLNELQAEATGDRPAGDQSRNRGAADDF